MTPLDDTSGGHPAGKPLSIPLEGITGYKIFFPRFTKVFKILFNL
jgi:hypothetical protein